MSFQSQIIATFSGALAAFIFSLVLFYLTEKWKNSKINKDLCQNLQKEFDYNINFLELFNNDIDKMLRKISSKDLTIFIVFRFYKLQRLFILETFNKGLLYKYLTIDDITDIDTMLTYFNNSTDQYAWNTLEDYQKGKILPKDALNKFEYDKTEVEKYIKILKKLKSKLKELK